MVPGKVRGNGAREGKTLKIPPSRPLFEGQLGHLWSCRRCWPRGLRLTSR